MSKRTASDPEWADEVIRRWRRRRDLPFRQAEAAFRRLGEELVLPIVIWLDRQLRRWPWLYRKLS